MCSPRPGAPTAYGYRTALFPQPLQCPSPVADSTRRYLLSTPYPLTYYPTLGRLPPYTPPNNPPNPLSYPLPPRAESSL